MSGYKPNRKTYHLNFEGTEYDGMEVSLRGLTTGKFLDLAALVNVADQDATAAEKLINLFVESLVKWNLLDEEDQPVPANRYGALAQDLTLVLYVIKAWMTAVAGVGAELGKESTSGSSLPVVNLPTELLSSSLVS